MASATKSLVFGVGVVALLALVSGALYWRMVKGEEALASAIAAHAASAKVRSPRPRILYLKDPSEAGGVAIPAPERGAYGEATSSASQPPEAEGRESVEDLEGRDPAAERAAVLARVTQLYESQPRQVELEQSHTRILEDALDDAFHGEAVQQALGRIECKGSWCTMPVSMEEVSDFRAFDAMVKAARNDLRREHGSILISFIPQDESGGPSGRYFFRWKGRASQERGE